MRVEIEGMASGEGGGEEGCRTILHWVEIGLRLGCDRFGGTGLGCGQFGIALDAGRVDKALGWGQVGAALGCGGVGIISRMN